MIRIKVACVFAVTLLAGVLFNVPTTSAVTAGDWKAGRIIDDAIFLNGNDMSAQQIQEFLNKKNPSCDTYGTQPSELGGGTRAQYGAAHNNPAPFTCLKDYYEVPKTSPGPGEPTSNYGHPGHIPAGAQSAAQIIYNAAQKHNINPKVLLVKLGTESPGPLTSDTWPFKRQFLYAMGAHCPDSGPNGAANCDPNYAGFSLQMDEAASLLRGYITNMSQPWWPYKKPYQTNSILWNVTQSGCGAGNVYIESKGTAALYTYTPYQPNQAALNNMYGKGDGCSAYGNRNFWRVYSDWFGMPISGSAWRWSVHSQQVFIDPAYQRPINYYPSAQPGQVMYVEIKAVNTGSLPWNNMTRVSTNSPAGRSSVFYDPSTWLSPNRPAALIESSVAPGSIGTFRFTLKAPQQQKTYAESFILVQDGVQVFNDIGQNFTINVTPQIPVRSVNRTLEVGSKLNANEYITSAATDSVLAMQSDGNLVLYSNFLPVWTSKTSGYPGSYLIMQGDGNLVLYSSTNKPLWNTATSGSGASSLYLQIDNNLVLYTPGPTTPVWSSDTSTPQTQPQTVNTRILGGGILYPGQRIETADRTRSLILQGDGNLVLYNQDMKPVWNSETDGEKIKFLAMQKDGNLVLYNKANVPVWNSGTAGHGTARTVLQDDMNLVIYKDNGQPIWATYTNR